jgi:signal peptidase I
MEKTTNWLFDLIKSAIFAIILVAIVRMFIAQPFVVSGQSMEPTFVEHEYMIVDQLSYKLSDPKRGDVIVFKYPKEPSTYYIKRIIGLPGETVSITNGTVVITPIEGKSFTLPEEYIINKDLREVKQEATLKEGEYFVLGDNRPVSSDSRIWGVLPKENIIGKPFVSVYPFSKLDIYPGSERYSN